MRYHSEPLGKRTEPVSYFQEGGNHAEQQCLSHMKESKQPDGPQVVDPKADRAQKMPIASHKEDSLRPKEKTTSEEFKVRAYLIYISVYMCFSNAIGIFPSIHSCLFLLSFGIYCTYSKCTSGIHLSM